MARGINKQILVGNLGGDPESRFTPSGTQVTSFRVATGEAWTDKNTGERKERTDWHNVVTFGRLAEIAGKYLEKGAQVYIEGKTRNESYDKDGETRYITRVYADTMQMLGNKHADAPDEPVSSEEQPDDDLPL